MEVGSVSVESVQQIVQAALAPVRSACELEGIQERNLSELMPLQQGQYAVCVLRIHPPARQDRLIVGIGKYAGDEHRGVRLKKSVPEPNAIRQDVDAAEKRMLQPSPARSSPAVAIPFRRSCSSAATTINSGATRDRCCVGSDPARDSSGVAVALTDEQKYPAPQTVTKTDSGGREWQASERRCGSGMPRLIPRAPSQPMTRMISSFTCAFIR